MLIQNKVGHDDWGKYAALYSLCHLGISFADLGLNQYLTKEIAGSDLHNEEISRKILSIKILTAVLFPFLMIGIGFFLKYDIVWLKALFLIAIIHSLIQFFGFFRAQIQGKQLFGYDAITSNLDKAILIILSFVVILIGANVWNYTIARIIAMLIATLVIYYICWKQGLFVKPTKNLSNSNKIIKLGLPFAFIALVYSINESVDQVMVERLTQNFTDINHSSIYSASYRLVNAIMMYLWIILPMFFAKFSHHESSVEHKTSLIKTGTIIVYLPVAFIAIFSIFHSHYLFYFFKNSNHLELSSMSRLFSILSYTLLLQGLFAILSTYLTSNGHEKFVTKLVVISIVFNLIANSIFIPLYGSFAAAWTTFGSACIVVAGYLIKIKTLKLVELPISTYIKLITISILSYSGYYLGQFKSDLLSIFLGMSMFIISFIVLKPIVLSDLKKIA